MDPITTTAIVTAIAAGAAAGASDVASQAIRDVYSGLKALILRKFSEKPQVSASLQLVEAQPDSEPYQQALATSLGQVHAHQAPDIAAQTQALLNLLKEQGVGATYMAASKAPAPSPRITAWPRGRAA